MGIRVDSGDTQPAVVFDRVHITTLQISQPLFDNDTLPPKYRIHIEYQLYGVDVHLKRHYKPGSRELDVDDFIAEAMKAAESGDMTLAAALPAIESALAYLIQQDINSNVMVI